MPYIAVRDPFTEAKDTLSSWDKCMAKTYCKWPVIVAIVIGSLIILSTVLCIVRCVCCGVKCATCCCSCCSCGSGGNDGHKRMKSGDYGGYPPPQGYSGPPIPPPAIASGPVHQQYRSHAAPTFNPAPAPEAPQYARFESPSKPVNEDSLPAMPSYSEAKVSYVEETVMPEKRGDLELDRLDHNGSVTPVAAAAAVGTRRTPVQRSPTQDSYGFPPGYQNDSFVSAAPQRNSPGPYGGQYEQQQVGHRGISPVSPVYGAGAGYGRNEQYGRASPSQNYNQQYAQAGPRRSPAPPSSHYDDYGYTSPDRSRVPVDMPQYDNYGAPPSKRTPSPEYYSSAAPVRSPSPGYAPSGSTRYEAPAAAYPGQQTYATESAYPGQQTYQAFQPQQTGVVRKPVEGSWKEL